MCLVRENVLLVLYLYCVCYVVFYLCMWRLIKGDAYEGKLDTDNRE